MAIKLGRMLTYLEGLLTIELHNNLIKWFLVGHVTNKKLYISTTKVDIATKFGRMVTDFDGFLSV